ncbi:hypothetical protein BDV95DRAFT_599236 [Massariosphaeria phaeospora]|uniref:Uncharacterized protein n=1 Tax=Massariosphaeria phaeospora TaxID=100035 RepID=A0A7C8I3R5_9PLEO|nr:hypothetical protein BDV95DRAFT_599236 [Massariosphaeria phaeospora]
MLGRRFAAKRLETILRNDGNTTAAPEKHLDLIYTTVLRSSVSADYTDEEREEQCTMLNKLLQSADEEVRQALADLHAILNIPVDLAQPLRLHHPSFRDFLLDKKRCDDDNF